MKVEVDGYTVENEAISEVIDKLAEADGSPIELSRIQYMAEAAKLLILATAEIYEGKSTV